MLGHDAKDALQETFLRAWRHFTSFEFYTVASGGLEYSMTPPGSSITRSSWRRSSMTLVPSYTGDHLYCDVGLQGRLTCDSGAALNTI